MGANDITEAPRTTIGGTATIPQPLSGKRSDKARPFRFPRCGFRPLSVSSRSNQRQHRRNGHPKGTQGNPSRQGRCDWLPVTRFSDLSYTTSCSTMVFPASLRSLLALDSVHSESSRSDQGKGIPVPVFRIPFPLLVAGSFPL